MVRIIISAHCGVSFFVVCLVLGAFVVFVDKTWAGEIEKPNSSSNTQLSSILLILFFGTK